jgi:arsenate reductase (glutaredoxin)
VAVTIYGIKNCDTMKKARSWLDHQSIIHRFHDYKVSGIERERLALWCSSLGWERVLNRNGTTFRKLSETERSNLDEHKALALMLAQPSIIKRPVLELDGLVLVGFSPESYAKALVQS